MCSCSRCPIPSSTCRRWWSGCPTARSRRWRATSIRIIASRLPTSSWSSPGLSPRSTRLMRECEPDVVGLSVMTFQRATAFKIARLVKHLRPATRIVVGGYDPSLAPEAYAPCADVDFLVRGEGEQTFCELLRALDAGACVSSIAGLSSRAESGWVHGAERAITALKSNPLRLPNRAARVLAGLYAAGTSGRCRRNVERLHLRLQLLLDHRDARPQLSRLSHRARDRRHRRCARPRRQGHLPGRRQHHARHTPLRDCCARRLSTPGSTISSTSCKG